MHFILWSSIASIYVITIIASTVTPKLPIPKAVKLNMDDFIHFFEFASDIVICYLFYEHHAGLEHYFFLSLFLIMGYQIIVTVITYQKTHKMSCAFYSFFALNPIQRDKLGRYDDLNSWRSVAAVVPFLVLKTWFVVHKKTDVELFTLTSSLFSVLWICYRLHLYDSIGFLDDSLTFTFLMGVFRFCEVTFQLFLLILSHYVLKSHILIWIFVFEAIVIVGVWVIQGDTNSRSNISYAEFAIFQVFTTAPSFVNMTSLLILTISKALKILVIAVFAVINGGFDLAPWELWTLLSFLIAVMITLFPILYKDFNYFDYEAGISENFEYFLLQQKYDDLLWMLDRCVMPTDPALAQRLHAELSMELLALKRYGFNLFGMGFSVSDLLRAGYTIPQLKREGVTCQIFHDSGLKVEHVIGYFTHQEIFESGYSVLECLEADLTLGQLRKGYTLEQICAEGVPMKRMLRDGIKISELRKAGYHALVFKEAGCTLVEMIHGRFSIEELREAGYTITEMLDLGASIRELWEGKYTLFEMRHGGVTLQELKELHLGFRKLRTEYDVRDFRQAGYTIREIANKTRIGGFDARALREGAYKIQELFDIGYTVAELRQGGYDALELRLANFPVRMMQHAGYTGVEVKRAGYQVKDLLEYYSIAELLEQGWTPKEIHDAGVPWGMVVQAGVRTQQFEGSGYQPGEIVNE